MFPPFPILGFALAKLRIFISNFRYIHKKQLADKNYLILVDTRRRFKVYKTSIRRW